MAGLEHLKLCDTAIETLDGIQTLKCLKYLEISNTLITDLTPLLTAGSLEEVMLDEGMRDNVDALADKIGFMFVYR